MEMHRRAGIWIACLMTSLGIAASACGQSLTPLGPWIRPEVQPSLPLPTLRETDWTRFQTDAVSGLPIHHESDLPESVPAQPPEEPAWILYSEPRTLSDWVGERRDELFLGVEKVQRDFVHMYTGRSLRDLGLMLAIAAPLANTEADENFSNWYRRHVRSRQTDDWMKIGNRFGEHWLLVPAFLGSAAIGTIFDESECAQWVGNWGKRSIRALIVGSPAVGVLQYGLGAGRPTEREDSSRWRPLNDNNAVAGHGFVGAVPFLTAASMTENRPLKALFFTGSFWTCAARVNNDAHFLSQAIIGWTIAYLSVRSVTETENEYRRWEVVPLDLPQGGSGIGVLLRF